MTLLLSTSKPVQYMYCVIGKSVLIKSGSSAAESSVLTDPMKLDVAEA